MNLRTAHLIILLCALVAPCAAKAQALDDPYVQAALDLRKTQDAKPKLVQGRSFPFPDGTVLGIAVAATYANPNVSIGLFRPGPKGPELIGRNYLTQYLHSDFHGFNSDERNDRPRPEFSDFITAEPIEIADTGRSILVRFLSAEGRTPNTVCDTVLVLHREETLFWDVLRVSNTACQPIEGRNLAEVVKDLRKVSLMTTESKVHGWREVTFADKRFRMGTERYQVVTNPTPTDEELFRILFTARDAVIPCDLGPRGKGLATTDFQSGNLRTVLRLNGQVASFNPYEAVSKATLVKVGSRMASLPQGKPELKCSPDGKVEVTTKDNPCAHLVYDIASTPFGSPPRKVLDGTRSDACSAAKKALEDQLLAQEREDPCSLTNVKAIRQEAEALAQTKGPAAAFSHLKDREAKCHSGGGASALLDHVSWLVADALLYGVKAKNYEGCSRIASKGFWSGNSPEGRTPGERAVTFNGRLCEGLRYTVTETATDTLRADSPKSRTLPEVCRGKLAEKSQKLEEATWTGDLNGDGRRDFYETWDCSGSAGWCSYTIWIGCGRNRFASVGAPEGNRFAVLNTRTKAGGSEWLDFELSRYAYREPYTIKYSFDGKEYSISPEEKLRVEKELQRLERQSAENPDPGG